MDLIKSHKYRSKASSFVYALLNIALAVAVFLTVYVTNSPIFALILVALSKWRIFSVRPRFWFANTLANLVDVIVGVSCALLVWATIGFLPIQIGLTILYIIWLLFIKPRSKYRYITLQAGVALFFGLLTLSVVAYSWDSFYFVACAWLITYACARHVASHYDSADVNLYSLCAALVGAELGWISYHWMTAYTIPGLETVRIPQFAIFATLMGFVAERVARSYHKHGKVRSSDVAMPITLMLLVMVVAYIFSVLSGSDAL